MIQISALPDVLLPDMTLGGRRTRSCSLAVRQALSRRGCWDRSLSVKGMESGPKEDEPRPKENGPRPSRTFQYGRWDGLPVPAGDQAGSNGGAARDVMRSTNSHHHGNATAIANVRHKLKFTAGKGRSYKESCASLVNAPTWHSGQSVRL